MRTHLPYTHRLIPKHSSQKASVNLADDIRAAIVRGAYEPGTRLPSEEEFIEQSGYSRATVREALRILERDGLVDIRRGATGGIFVRRPDHASIARSIRLLLQFDRHDPRVILETRRELEVLCVRLAAERISEDEIAQLRQSVERLRTAEDSEAAARENLVFHLAIVGAVRNPVLQALVGAVRSLLYDSTITLYYRRDNVLGAAVDHSKIVEALAARDPTLAASRMTKHLAAFEKNLVETGQIEKLLEDSGATAGAF